MKSLKMEIEKTDEWDKVGNYLNTQIVFECGKTVLNDSLLEELCDIIADIFEDAGDGVYKLKYGKNTILIEDGEILDEFIKEEILEAAERLFIRQIIDDVRDTIDGGALYFVADEDVDEDMEDFIMFELNGGVVVFDYRLY